MNITTLLQKSKYITQWPQFPKQTQKLSKNITQWPQFPTQTQISSSTALIMHKIHVFLCFSQTKQAIHHELKSYCQLIQYWI